SRIGEAIRKYSPAVMPSPMPAYSGAGAKPVINITQNISFTGAVDTATAKEVSATVSTATREAVWKAIDEYFRRKQRTEWR
ncbi:MAG TPA: hypothetical protein PKU94_07625, partial [Candidatus Hydrothermia bacterium]|nr:hypothetical protein [Candidatus Hydrothermia bacterium]